MARQDVIDEVLYLRSAGLDLGKRFLLACVRVPNPKRQGIWSLETERFGTTPAEVRRPLAWLTERRVELVVMELVAFQAAQIEKLTVRVKELEAMVGRNSRNSSKPPSSDGLAKPEPKSLRKRSGRKPGGQAGHPGSALRQVSDPDEIVRHEPGWCGGCGAGLGRAPVSGVERRQVFDIPQVRVRVVEHQLVAKLCGCGTVSQATAPGGVTAPVQYGPMMTAVIVYLYVAQFLSKKRTATALADLFGVPVSAGTVANATSRAADGLTEFLAAARAAIAAAPVPSSWWSLPARIRTRPERGVRQDMRMSELLLRGGRPWRSVGPAEVLVRDGVIAGIGPGIDAPGAEIVDVSGRLVLPGLVEAHCHLDKTLYGRAWEPHSAGDALADRIGNERRRRGELGLPDADSAAALLERMVTAGTSYVRTHTDVYAGAGLGGVEAVWEAVRRLDGRVMVEQVAFPQSGILGNPGTAELLDEALKLGVETIGGIDPAGMDRDPVRHLDVVFGLAERHGAGIDIHLHDGGTLGAFELELIIERTRATGLGGKVTVSHAYALGQIDAAYQDRLAAGLAVAGITVTTAAVFDFPVPPIKKLRAAGVNIACGHDDIRDLWSPYGTGDMLERAMHVAYRSTFRRDEDIEIALEAATYGGARALGLESYGLAVGAPADLVVLAADTPAAAVVTRPVRDLVLKAGRVVAREGRLS